MTLRKKIFFKKNFLGAFPADIIPEISSLPCCWIWNTDEQNQSGKHWVAVWLTKKKLFFLIVLQNQFLFIHENIGKK